jgi:DNA repair exonuclease SbcCD ATPase subunit
LTLKRLSLRNVQPHRRLVIDLDPHVTVLVGESFAGKSTVLRALRLLCLNQPRGNSYVRHGQRYLRVQLALQDRRGKKGGKERLVEIRRGKGANAYYLDGKRYAPEKRRSVPQAIESLINVGPENFQRQDEPAFWLFDSPGQVAKSLNEIADLETMDRVMGNIAAEVRKSSSEVTFTKARLKEAKAKLEELVFVPSLVKRLERLERSGERYRAIRSRIASLTRAAGTVSEYQRTIDRLSQSIFRAKTACRIGRTVDVHAVHRKKLSKLVERIQEASLPKLPDPRAVYAARRKADDHAERRRRLESLVRSIKEKEERCEELQKDLSERERSSALRTSNSKKKCPTCGRPWHSSPSQTSTSRTTPRRRVPRKAKTGTG